ncbi:type III restriction-modification system endonuclease [Sunxiuqinia rutila]|uniref:type III restriction-modification system endonuclease n=1 Tax=Sunxiuqinia rutila TaxID=1397841 RepID=UPI003D3619CD
MKLQFKEQQFQIQAVGSVVECFKGQPMATQHFTLERTRELQRRQKMMAAGDTQAALAMENEILENIGYRNRQLAVTESQLLENIQEVQHTNEIIASSKVERPAGYKNGYHLTIEMETGTGKTYTYIRTMYELHKHYGWSKFIIVVPSVAIREGVYKSFEITQDHFQERYGHKIKPFIYNSARPQDIENFAADSRISVMIINTQAYARRGKDALLIHKEQDKFGTRAPIQILAQTNPILIIDEPQSVDGKVSLEMMQHFNPLFTVRYSATHKIEYNKVFRLDALDAYNHKLVKKIQVKGINLKGSTGTTGYLYLEQIILSSNKPPVAVIEYEKRNGSGVKRVREKLSKGANIYQLSGEMPQYKNCTVQEIDGYFNKIVVNGEDLHSGEAMGDLDEKAFRRIQIRETILSHLEKEKELYGKGIKVLSLFFIDSVEKYRKYDGDGNELLGEYARIFEEEYNLIRNEFIDLFNQEYNDYLHKHSTSEIHRGYAPTYLEYLNRDEASQVHNGYFSIDKKNRLVDPKVKRGKEDSEDTSAYDLIMKNKEQLMSFEEPVRFIFSHSALKEGWDNPNVFQICALKHAESGSTNRRRQEVGRGMRLCVNKHGVRLDYDSIGDEVHEINKLTVVASESYEAFAKGLQSEIASTLKDRPQKANVDYFVGKVVKDEKGVEIRITKEQANRLNKILYKNDIIDEDDRITAIGRQIIESGKIDLPEEFQPFQTDVTRLMKSVYSGEPFKPEDERGAVKVSVNQNFHKKEFQELWNKINLKTIYEVNFNSEKLISDSINKINADLHISDRIYEVKSGELLETTKEELENKEAFKETRRATKKLNTDIYTNTAYDIVGEIVNKTNLTRRSVVAILKEIKEQQFYLVRKNPEEFIAKSAGLINEVKASLIINNIVYHKTEERHDAHTIFTNDKSALRQSEILKRHIYDYLITDSQVEQKFAEALENSEEVTVYAKLPKSFHITTPVANYSPDWAIVFDKEKVRHIYFVAETKGSEKDMDLKGIEALKIHCATKHFDEISDGSVKYHKLSSYEKMLEIVQVK